MGTAGETAIDVIEPAAPSSSSQAVARAGGAPCRKDRWVAGTAGASLAPRVPPDQGPIVGAADPLLSWVCWRCRP